MANEKERVTTEVICENCGRKAVHRRSGGKFCSQKCRVENWWKKKVGASKLVAVATGLVMLAGACGGQHNQAPTPLSADVGTYTGVLHWTVRNKVFEDQRVTIEVAQEGASLTVSGRVIFARDTAPLPPMTCSLDGSSCRAAGAAQDATCGSYEFVSVSLTFGSGTLDYSGVSNSEWCATWHLFGTLVRS
jgi:hypothetical protein